MTAPVAPAAVPPDTPPAAALVKFDGGTISLDVKDNAYAGIGDAFAALITAKLSSSDRLRMVDRRFLAEVPKETRLSNLASSRLIIGKIIDAKYLICGAYTIEGDQVAVSMWMDSTETGQVLESKSVSGRIQDFHAVAQKLAVDFLQEFQQTTSAQAVYSASAVNRRTTVAVSDFYGRSVPPGNEKKDPLGKALAGFLIADLGASSKLCVLDREHTPEILLEQRLATTQLSDPARRVRVGQILVSQYFVFGSYAIAPNEQTILTAQIVSVAAGQIVESKSVSGDSKDFRALSQRLAADLRQSLEHESTLGRQGVLENRRLEPE